MLTRSAILIPLAAALAGGSAAPDRATSDEPPSVADIAEGYKHFPRITERVVVVNPQFAMLCAGATQHQVDQARARHGPHANTGILVYMNQPAKGAFEKRATPFPVGAAIVKEKTVGSYVGEDGKLTHDADQGVGGMVKRAPGYDPAHGDWEYFYFEDAKKIEAGRIPSCVACHASAKATDHVFGTWQKQAD